MTAHVRKFYPEVRLKKLVGGDRGILVSDALTRAEAGVDSIRDRCLDAVDDKIERLLLCTSLDSVDECYALANEVYAEAGAFGLQELSAAAHSLCTLISGSGVEKQIILTAIKVHVDAMRALRRPEVAGSPELRSAVISELRSLAARIGGRR
ncbi:MAG: hypothetical protein R3C27_08435 [Hyphomonadaceae bacterium]